MDSTVTDIWCYFCAAPALLALVRQHLHLQAQGLLHQHLWGQEGI